MWSDLPVEIRRQILTCHWDRRERAALTIQTAWRGSVARFTYQLAVLAVRILGRS